MKYVDYDETDLQSFSIIQAAISNDDLLGSCELGTAEIQMLNGENQYSDIKNKWIRTVRGSFYIYDVEPVQERVNIKLKCYDVKYLLDVPYKKDDYINMFPCPLFEWRNKMASDLGIKFNDNNHFANSNFVLSSHPFVEEKSSYRDVFKSQAQAGASWIETDENDNFYFSWIKEDDPIFIEDWFSLITEKNKIPEINEVVLGRGDVEDIVIYPTPAPDNAYEIRIDNNYILDPQENININEDRRYQVIEPIYNRVNGLSYIIFDMTTQSLENCFNLKLGSKIKYLDNYNNELESIVMSKEYNWLGEDLKNPQNWEVTISAKKLKSTQSKYSYSGKIKENITKIGINVDKANEKIDSTIERVNEFDSSLTQIEQTVDSITQQVNAMYDFVREAKGNNKIKIEEVQENGILEIHITGEIQQPIVSDETLVSDETILKSTNLIFENEESIQRVYLPINYLNVLNDISDEFVWELIYDDELKTYIPKAKIIRRIVVTNGEKKLRFQPIEQELESFNINIEKGTYDVYLESFRGLDYSIKYVVVSELTDILATKLEVNSAIIQTNNSITQQVNAKLEGAEKDLNAKLEVAVDTKNLVSKINAVANEIEITSDNFHLSKNGTISILQGSITIDQDENNISTPIVLTQIYEGETYRGQMGGSGTSYYLNDNNGVLMRISPTTKNGVLYLYNTNNPNEYNYVTPTGIRTTSDERYKDNIKNIDEIESYKIINELNPIIFTYKNSKDYHRGLIAQEVKRILNKNGINEQIYSKDLNEITNKEVYSLNYVELIPDLINYCKYLNKKVEELERKNKDV